MSYYQKVIKKKKIKKIGINTKAVYTNIKLIQVTHPLDLMFDIL